MKFSILPVSLTAYSLIAGSLAAPPSLPPSPPSLAKASTLSKRDDYDPRDNFVEGAEIVVNGFSWMIPIAQSRQITVPIEPALDIVRAGVHRAPMPFHCFFSSVHQELPSGYFDYVRDLKDPYQAATSITCQTLYANRRYSTFVVWVRYADDDINGDGNDDDDEAGERTDQRRGKEELLNLPAHKSTGKLVFDDERDVTVEHTGEARQIVAAVLMIQPQGWHECRLIGAERSDAERTFDADQPISGFSMSVKAISCYPSEGEGRDQETYSLSDIR